MDSSSVCEKNKDENDGEKLKKLFINSPFEWKYLALKQVEKTSTIDKKNWL